MGQMRIQNPQMFQQINQLRNSNTNPKALVKQIIGNSTPEQMQMILNQAKSLGAPESVLTQIQNMR